MMAEIRLTENQRAVVEDRGGTLLVSAAAGSGKTKVLIDRVLARVSDERCNVDDFLMITFTQAAASELRGKLLTELSRRLTEQPENRHLQHQLSRVYLAQISTVHAFCGAILREYVHRTSLPADFRVSDEQENAALRDKAMQRLLAELYAQVRENADYTAALEMLGAGRDERRLRELIYALLSSVQAYPDPNARLEAFERMVDVSDCSDAGQTVWGAYLLEEARVRLRDCMEMLRSAQSRAQENESVVKYAPTFASDAEMLDALLQAQSWDDFRSVDTRFGRLPTIRGCADPDTQEQLKAVRKRVKDEVERIRRDFSVASCEALADLALCMPALRGLLRLTKRLGEIYCEEKRRRHLLDYDDLEHEAYRLLCRDGRPTAAARELSSRYVEIMVDEYQDTNAVQDAVFSALGETEGKLFFVGDVKQSIYRFRLADPSIFLSKYLHFADRSEARDGAPRRILLSDNFRSDPQILAATNDVFSLLMTPRIGGLYYTDAEALRPGLRHPEPEMPAVELHVVDAVSDDEQDAPDGRTETEAAWLAERIRRMLDGECLTEGEQIRPIRPEDIVILLRSLRGKAPVYTSALRSRGIPCVCGNDDLFSAEEIRFLCAFFQILSNPHQDVPLLTVLFSPVVGMQADTLARIRAAQRSGDLFDILSASEEAECFASLLRRLRREARLVPVRELLDALDDETDFMNIYGAMGAQKRRNMEEFYAIADEYDRSGSLGLPGFLRRLEQLRQRGRSADAGNASGAIRIMSIHKSKGLEFPVVVLADLCKPFNMLDLRQDVLTDPELGIGCSALDAGRGVIFSTIAKTAIGSRSRRESLSEEMRILYVAMTRAKQKLLLSCCAKGLPSRLTRLAQELTVPPSAALIERALCPGDWILMTALLRSEAGELFRRAAYPAQRRASEYPWRIEWHDAVQTQTSVRPQETTEAAPVLPQPQFLPPYAHETATRTPAKLTATQLKGRAADEEVADSVPSATVTIRRPKPRFMAGLRPLTPAQRGTAIHLAMQFVDYACCETVEGATRELERLVAQHFLTAQQAQAVEPQTLVRFFQSPTGQRVLHAEKIVREFKFSVLENAERFDKALSGETVLLQGVTDCCILEPDGLTVLDFKSDRVVPGTEAERAAFYRGQLDAYSRALSRIFECPVKERVLYFFATDTAVSI